MVNPMNLALRFNYEQHSPFSCKKGYKRTEKPTRRYLLITVLLSLLSINSAHSQLSNAKGQELATQMDQHSSGYQDLTASLTMTIIDRQQRQRLRQLSLQILEDTNKGDKTLATFVSPADQRGVALLTHSHKTKANDQWLYLPSIKRIKKIASSNQSGSFMGSDFTYEDLAPVVIEKYNYQFLREEPCAEDTCSVIVQTPKSPDSDSGYSQQIIWLDSHYRIQKIELYDLVDRHYKTLLISGYKLINNRFWQAGRMHMKNHSTGQETVLDWQNYRLSTGLKNAHFTTRALKKRR